MLLVILKAKELLEHFTKKNCQKTNQKEFRVEKVIKRKGDELYVKWKGYNNLFNSWIDQKSYICEDGGARLRISVWHLLMNLTNNYLLKKTVEVGQ